MIDEHFGRALLGVPLLAFLGACGSEGTETTQQDELSKVPVCIAPDVDVDPRRSLMITDQDVLGDAAGPFGLRRVLGQLASTSGATNGSATGLFRQLWDTQNPAPGLGLGPNCTDDGGTINGWPSICRAAEGAQASTNPAEDAVRMDSYFPVALVNRFDLAPVDGSHCGEYRIVYSKGDCPTCGFGRNFVIFESVLPNPSPGCGLAACRPVQELWAKMSGNASAARRQAGLSLFYFDGYRDFAPVIHADHFALAGQGGYGQGRTGQIRTNQFMQGPWMLKEFKLRSDCNATERDFCDLDFVPVSVKDNPAAVLFDSANSAPIAQRFQQSFAPTHVATLAVPDVNGFSFNALANPFNDAQSPVDFSNRYATHFGAGPSPLRTSIDQVLFELGSGLNADHIVARAEALSCKGCHQNSNNADLGEGVTFPSSLGFVHTSEFTEQGPDGPRFLISSALTDVFLPQREAIMEGFLRSHSCVSCDPVVGPGTDPAVDPATDPALDPARRPEGDAADLGAVRTLGGRATH